MPTEDNRLDNLELMFQKFTEATLDLQRSHDDLQKKIATLTVELEEKNIELRKKERLAAIGEMAASIAHEIRNPLGGIELYTSLIKKKSETKEAELCTKILSGVERLNKIVEDLLNYAKDYHPEHVLLDVNSLSQSIIDCVEVQMTKKNVDLKFSNLSKEKHMVGDKNMLTHVLLNLLTNAVQAAKSKVLFSFQQKESVNIFTIEDDGLGIPDEQKLKIFQPFYTTKSTGSGLGLAIVNRFVESHNGHIFIETSDLGGAKFILQLPDIKN